MVPLIIPTAILNPEPLWGLVECLAGPGCLGSAVSWGPREG